MQRWINALAFIVFSVAAQAAVMETRIVDVEMDADRLMVMAETEGRVLWVNATDSAMVRAFETAQAQEHFVRVSYDAETGVVSGAELMAQTTLQSVRPARNKDTPAAFNPTVFNSVAHAQSYFNTMDSQTKDDSQCYNRAHGWAYDLWSQYRINSLKIFIFFTRRYIREYDYKWWFHVSPMVLVGSQGRNYEYVMDRSFTRGPVEVRTWTDIFMKNRAFCPHVRYYTDYRNHQEAEYCYLMKSIMYYSTPRDLEYLESQGRYETDWVYSELKAGRRQAFINWQRYDP